MTSFYTRIASVSQVLAIKLTCTLDSDVRDCFVIPNESRTSRSTALFLEIYIAAYTWFVCHSSNLQSFGDGGKCFL
jgi:hypothetical protein